MEIVAIGKNIKQSAHLLQLGDVSIILAVNQPQFNKSIQFGITLFIKV